LFIVICFIRKRNGKVYYYHDNNRGGNVSDSGDIKSYVIRGGKLTKRQSAALAHHADHYLVPYQNAPMDRWFDNDQPIICDIGFGMGHALIEQARAHPEKNFLGIEVYPAGVGSVVAACQEHGCTNIRIVQHDAIAVLRDMVLPQGFAKVQLLYPDPWPKKRHHKRRIMRASFIHEVIRVLPCGGYFQVVTDWQPYADEIQLLMKAYDTALLATAIPDEASISWPDIMSTAFARKGLAKGHAINNLVYQKT